jgi:hypothetical protein
MKSVTPRVGVARWTAGTDTVSRTDFDSSMANIEARALVFYQGTLSSRPAAGIVGRQHVVVDSSDTANNGRITYDNGTSWIAPRYLINGVSESSGASLVPFTVRGVSGQTTDYFRVEATSGGDPLFRVASSGASTNQVTPGVSGSAGAYLGRSSGHDAALGLVSVAVNKPVLVVAGAVGQTGVLASFRNSAGASVASIDNAGNGTFTGNLTANVLTAQTLNVPNLSSGGGSSFTNSIFNTANAGSVPLSIFTLANQTANIVEMKDGSSSTVNRFPAGGGYATNQRVNIGANATGTGLLTGPVLLVNNTIDPGIAAARFMGNSAQAGGNIVEATNASGAVRWAADIAGNTTQTGLVAAPRAVIGGSTITLPFSGTTPILEMVTGSAAGTYDENVVLRHSVSDATAVSRKMTLQFKQSNESSSGESLKWAGVGSQTSIASAGTPSLVFYTAGTEAGRFDANNNLTVGGNINMSSGNQIIFPTQIGYKMSLYAGEGYSMGVQNNTFYQRSQNHFGWYRNGAYSATTLDPGVNGTLLASLSSAGVFTTSTVRVDSGAYDDSTTGVMVGPVDSGHLSLTGASINLWSGPSSNLGNTASSLNIANNGSTLNLGQTGSLVRVIGRFDLNGKGLYIQATAPAGTDVTENDIWINVTNAGRVMIRKSSAWVAIGT